MVSEYSHTGVSAVNATKDNPQVPCACGCGGMRTAYDKSGIPRRFIAGHGSRVNHPMLGRRMPQFGTGKIFRGYRMVYVSLTERGSHNVRGDGYEFEHRYVMEKALGRRLERSEVVHHINGDKLDNRSANLMLMSPSGHSQLECKGKPSNPVCIEAMRRKNMERKPGPCEITGCLGITRARGLCVKHYHDYQKGYIQFLDGQWVDVPHQRKRQESVVRICRICSAPFATNNNAAKNCEICRQPRMEVKRWRERKKNERCLTRPGS